MKRKKTKNLKEDRKQQKLKELKKSEGLFIGTPIHSDVSLHYMKSCLDLQIYPSSAQHARKTSLK